MNITVKSLDEVKVEIEGELDGEKFMSYKDKAVEYLGRDLELPGFRKGKAPANVIEQHLLSSALLQEMAELALAEHYPQILKEKKIDAIGRPEIMITKLAKDNPLGFKITTEIMPEITLPNYKKIAKESKGKEVADTSITHDELEQAILEIRKMRAHQKMHEDNVEHHSHDHAEIKEEELPPFDDDFVKALGNFEHVEDFKTKLKDNMTLEKTQKEKEKNRIAIVDALIEASTLNVPRAFIEGELHKMLAKLQGDIEQAGFTFDDYLKQLGKTVEEIRKEWEPDAVKRAKMELIIHKIAEEEKLAPEPEVLKKEVDALMEHYKGVERFRAEAYVLQMMTAQKVFEFLEQQ